MTLTVTEVTAALERAYPTRLAEPWDTGIGLTCGDAAATVRTVLLAVDVDAATVGEAEERGAELLITHHPLLFRPVQTVAATTDKGSLVHHMIRTGIAHYAAHTNADRAVRGVSDALADAIGLARTAPLVPTADGAPGEGLGRIGDLPAAMTLADLAAHVAAVLPETVWGVRAAGDPRRVVHRVAVCGGAGGSELPAATASGADVYVTSDVTHHMAAEHVADPTRPALIDVAHWAGEWPWLGCAAEVLRGAFGDRLAVEVSTKRTDAWTVSVPPRAHPV